MIKENGDIFLAGGDALVHLAKPVHKKYSTKFVWGQKKFKKNKSLRANPSKDIALDLTLMALL